MPRLFTRPVVLSLESLDARDGPAFLSLNLPVSLPLDIPLVTRVLGATASLGLLRLTTVAVGLHVRLELDDMVVLDVPLSPPVTSTPDVPATPGSPDVPASPPTLLTTPPDSPTTSPASPATPPDSPTGSDSVTPTPAPPIVVPKTPDVPPSPAVPSPTPTAPAAPATGTPAPVVEPPSTTPSTPTAPTPGDVPQSATAPPVSFAPTPTATDEPAAVRTPSVVPVVDLPATTPPTVASPAPVAADDTPTEPEFAPPAVPPAPAPDAPAAPAPPADFAVDAAALLNRFLPFDLGGLRAQAQAVFDDLGAALPDADDLSGERGWWYAAALAGMVATRRGITAKARRVRRVYAPV